ncbi:hypothetical protein [Streptomyces sp. NRRL F-2799]|uniref:hypothetical protein n=1 Tax=Streptomyces sp. NRRL F-2799 TaxID=1463844 RepID=UPI00068B01B5|nr:hypothetical protein [Streptomyces sp. NRRL F-2799]
MFTARGVGPLLLTAALLTGCSSAEGSVKSAASARTSAPASSAPAAPSAAPASPALAPPEVRDSFAVLQATYNDGCTTEGNCEYFLNRVLSNLTYLHDSMKASPKGPGHFAVPLAWTDKLRETVGADPSFPDLKRHQKLLLDTRDKVNIWMQSHPEDYR